MPPPGCSALGLAHRFARSPAREPAEVRACSLRFSSGLCSPQVLVLKRHLSQPGNLPNHKAGSRTSAPWVEHNLHGGFQEPGPYQIADSLEVAVVRNDQRQPFARDAAQQRQGRSALHLSSPYSIACPKNPKLGYPKSGCNFARVSRGLHPTYKKLSSLLAEARASAGLTQAQVAERLKRPQSFVSKYENGERQLDVVEFIAVCKAIGISPPEVLNRIA